MDTRGAGESEQQPRPPLFEFVLDRRRFLILAGGAAAYAALRPHWAWARDAANPRLHPWSLPSEPPDDPIDLARALIAAAVLAPNYWNSQPWRFEVEGPSIRLVADMQRALPITDPDRRSLMMSLGAALENLLVAARAYGFRPAVNYFPFDGAGGVVAEVSLAEGNGPRDRPRFQAITQRRTNRRDYDGRGIYPQNRAQLIAQAPGGFRVRWLDDHEQIESIADIARQAVLQRVSHREAQAEQYRWMRFGDEAERRGDGLTPDALDLGGPARWLARRYFNPDSWFLKFGAQSAGKQTRTAIRSAGALALLTTERGGAPQWVIGGQVYERFALEATLLGIAHQPINPPIEMEPYRSELIRRFGAAGEEPLMLLRLGHAQRPDPTARRSVAQVASFRKS